MNSLHGLLPGEAKQTIDGRTNAKNERRKPKTIDSISSSTAGEADGELESCRGHGGEESGHGREVKEIGCTVLLREPNGGYAWSRLLGRADGGK